MGFPLFCVIARQPRQSRFTCSCGGTGLALSREQGDEETGVWTYAGGTKLGTHVSDKQDRETESHSGPLTNRGSVPR